VIVPIYRDDHEASEVLPVVEKVRAELQDFRVKVDDRTEVTPGFKFNDWELRGVPLRIEIGPKDVAKGMVAAARRDIPGREGKAFLSQEGLAAQVRDLLDRIQLSLFEKALAFRKQNTYEPQDYAEFQEVVKHGWAFSWWCKNPECEIKIKEDTKATTRCIPFDQSGGSGPCIYCGQPATEKVYFARAY
jgi:prolyl-tRNA synthetase